MAFVKVCVGEAFAGDERLTTDAEFGEDVLKTGLKIVRLKEEVETRHVLDSRSQALIKEYEVRIETLTKEYERKKEKMLRIYEEKEEEIARKKQEIQVLQHELQTSTSATYESGRVQGRKDLDVLLEREKAELKERKAELKEKNIEIERLREENHKELERLREETRHEFERLREEKDMNRHILSELEGVHNIFKKSGRKGLSSVELGEMGQSFVYEWIVANFNPAKISVVHAEAHSADLLFEYDNTHILIEVKNKNHHLDREEDLKKFHNDIHTHSKKGFPRVAALLVSLYDLPLIHGHRTSYIESRHGMPVMYVGGALEAPVLITAALHLLPKLALIGPDNETSSSSENELDNSIMAHKNTAVRFMVTLRQVQEDINKDRKHVEEMMVRLNERERSLVDSINYQAELVKQFPAIEEEVRTVIEPTVGSSGGKRTINRETVVAWIRQQAKEQNKATEANLFEKFGIGRHQLQKMGGITKLRADAKKETQTVIAMAEKSQNHDQTAEELMADPDFIFRVEE